MAVDAVVIGAGVSGLTTAVCLLEAGATVLVRTAASPIGTTSAVAGAMIGPAFGDEDDPEVAWTRVSDLRFRELAELPGTGVSVRRGRLLTVPSPGPGVPLWAARVPGVAALSGDDLPDGYPDGFRAEVPFADMPVYLAWLLARVGELGGRVELRPVTSLTDAADDGAVVVNCSGLGAAVLAGDRAMTPVLGQHVIVDCPGLQEFVYECGPATEWVGVMPHGRRVVLGGISRPGVTNLVPDPAVTAAILQRCRAVVPELADAPVLGVEVGLRPGRPQPRVAAEDLYGLRVVHNYGHAGHGVMLSWGCGEEAARLVLA